MTCDLYFIHSDKHNGLTAGILNFYAITLGKVSNNDKQW